MKTCVKCNEQKDDFQFNKKTKNKDGTYRLQSYCKECGKKCNKENYKKNLKRYIDKAKKNNSIYKKINIENIIKYLKAHPCVDCGEKNPLVLEFDHRDPKTKDFEVSVLISRTTWSRVFEEIEKCDVRCANCHRIKTAKERNFIMYQIIGSSH